MQNWSFNFNIFSFRSFNFQFCQFSPLTFNFYQFKAPLQIRYCCHYTHQNCPFKKKTRWIKTTSPESKQNKRIPIPNFERESEPVWERETKVAPPARRVNHLAALPWLNQWWVCSALPYRSSSSPVLGLARGAWRVQEECHIGQIVHEFLNRLWVGISWNRVSDTNTRHVVWERSGHLREF